VRRSRKQYMKKYRREHRTTRVQYDRKYYLTHRGIGRRRIPLVDGMSAQSRHYYKFKDWWGSLKAGPCADCRHKFPPECMDWDHVRGRKLADVGTLRCRVRDVILKEIAKCDLVCANCHRIRTTRRKRECR